MLRSKNQNGFTIIELLIVMVVGSIVTTVLYTFFTTSLNQYFMLQADGMSFGNLSSQSQRIAMVTRGLTGVTYASDDELSMYAYFSPRDSVQSLVRYYKSPDGKKLMADVTPMTSNPPIGTPKNDEKKTYTIADPFFTLSSVTTFTYYDGGNNKLATPVTNQNLIQQVQISLAAPSKAPSPDGYNHISVQVSLRNRKVNL